MPKELPKFSYIILAIVFGTLLGIGLFKLSSNGNLNFNFNNLSEAKISSSAYNLNKTNVAKISQTQTILNEESVIIDVVAKSSPSVVAIGTNQNPTMGTGFIVSEKGIVVTNKHVVGVNAIYNVITRDGKKFEVRKIYRDPVLDLAIVQIDEGGLQSLNLGNSSNLKVGQTVIAIGNALGKLTNTVTTGVVSGLGRQVIAGNPFSGSSESLDNLIQTDAAINMGNSGGPLLNSAGQVIGVNVATTDGAQSIGFAIPIDSVKKVINEFVDKGAVSKPYLGIKYNFINKDMASLNKTPIGAYVQDVILDSPAQKAGIEIGDIITKIDGKNVLSETQITDLVNGKKIGDTISLTLWNNGKERSVLVTLQELINAN
ncbi:MAG: trypsin-like peptidase domain-containing protein [Candidatus Daviesbacteria bacterium]|nr:trypsin-like peptidase domain-containing protein [Candidatus Daviesbacteria bacterium]